MAGRHGHKSATAVQDAPTGARHRSPDRSSTTVTVADLVPEGRATATPSSPPASERRRRWPWLLLVATALVALAVARFGGDPDPGPPAAAPLAAPAAPGLAPAPSTAPAPAPTGTVTLPRLRERDAAAVLTEFRGLGLTDVRLVTDDDRTVEDPGKWTAVGLQPRPGTAVLPDRPVMVTVSQGGQEDSED